MSKSTSTLKRLIQVALGVGFFTLGLVIVVLRRLSSQRVPAAEGVATPTPAPAPPPAPARGVPLKKAATPVKTAARQKASPKLSTIPRPAGGKPAEAALKPLPLKLRAKPATFKRGQTGTIYAETLPGASCSIDAIYSTRRRPAGLDNEGAIAEGDGVLEWAWKINTTGDYVEVTVRGELKGYQAVETKLRVKIAE